MPVNITQPNSAKFVVEFLSSAGTLVTPSSGNLTVTYNISGVANSTTIAMAQTGSYFTATWDTTPADLGLASYSISGSTSAGITNPAAVGYINVIDP